MSSFKEHYDPESYTTNKTIIVTHNPGIIMMDSQVEDLDFRPKIKPTIEQNIEDTNTGTKTSFGKFIMNNIVAIIIAIIGGLIVSYLAWKFGWI